MNPFQPDIRWTFTGLNRGSAAAVAASERFLPELCETELASVNTPITPVGGG